MAIYNFDTALVRAPAKSVTRGLSASANIGPDYNDVVTEHEAYVAALRAVGVTPILLSALEDFPDSIFVEDPALVFSEAAILLRPGAPSRQKEAAEIAPALHGNFDTVLSLPPTGTVEGGDILAMPNKVMIGLSSRTNLEGANALQNLLAKLGRKSDIVATPQGVLHFKSDCALLDEETILSTSRLAKSDVFKGFNVITVPDGEEPAANALRINGSVMVRDHYPRNIERLDRLNYKIVALKTDAIAKIDAGLSCMSLRWQRAVHR